MRIMGHKPIPMREFGVHLGELRSLLDGNETDVTFRGATAPTKHLMPNEGFVNFRDRIPMFVSAFGPKAMALAAQHGDGLVMSVPPVASAVAATWKRLRNAASAVGREISPDNYLTCTLTTMVVLEEGESRDSARVREECGAFAISGLHYAYEQSRQLGRSAPGFDPDMWEEYCAVLERVPAERRHMRIHAGHNCWVEPEEERFITPELIERTCLVGTADELVARLKELEAAGLSQVMILPPLAPKEKVLHDVGTKVIPRLS